MPFTGCGRSPEPGTLEPLGTVDPAGVLMTTFAFHHVGLSVGDLDAQRRFYRDAFGLAPEQQAEIPRAGVRMAILRGSGGLQIELIERTGSTEQNFTDVYDGASVQGYFHFAVQVADLDTTYEAVLAAGATSVSAPRRPPCCPGCATPMSKTLKATSSSSSAR